LYSCTQHIAIITTTRKLQFLAKKIHKRKFSVKISGQTLEKEWKQYGCINKTANRESIILKQKENVNLDRNHGRYFVKCLRSNNRIGLGLHRCLTDHTVSLHCMHCICTLQITFYPETIMHQQSSSVKLITV